MPLPARPLGCDPGVRQGSELWEQRGTEGPLGPRPPEEGVGQVQELTALAVPASLTHAGCVPAFGAMNESQSSRGAIPVLPGAAPEGTAGAFLASLRGVCEGRRFVPAIAVISHANQVAGMRQGVLKFIQAIT